MAGDVATTTRPEDLRTTSGRGPGNIPGQEPAETRIARGAAPPRSAWRGRVPVVVAIAVAWVLAVVAEATGDGAKLHHDALIHGTLPTWAALSLFLVAWQAMIAAMMLPSSLPMI